MGNATPESAQASLVSLSVTNINWHQPIFLLLLPIDKKYQSEPYENN